jgi:response regulator RpfG family c-di-GMP phosphodiesterase
MHFPEYPLVDPRYTVLYVDDEVHNLRAFAAEFRRDARILVASNIPDAIYQLENEPVDMLVTDHKMPEGTGLDMLAAAVREFPDVVRVMITAYGTMDLLKEAVNLGHVDWYLEKPWEARELQRIIHTARREAVERDARRSSINGLLRKVHEGRATADALIAHLERHADAEGAALAHSIRHILTQVPAASQEDF